jgi:D-alanine-D-alanine ligase
MRPLTFGILVCGGLDGPQRPHPGETPTKYPHTIEQQLDHTSGSDLAQALRTLGHQAHLIGANEDLDLSLRHSDLDACLLALHGRRGGSGDVQALLTLRGIPFPGAAAGPVALAFDKVHSRQMLAYHNLPVPAAVVLGPQERASERALELLGWPCFVKPRRGALGLGVARLASLEDIRTAIGAALEIDDEVVLERAIEGREVQVALVGERVLGSVERVRHEHDDCRDGSMICPPKLSRSRLDGIHNLARRAVSALGLRHGLTRVDVLVSERHNELILEVEPLPPLDRDSVMARVGIAAGWTYERLVAEIVDRIMLRAPEHAAEPQPLLLQ